MRSSVVVEAWPLANYSFEREDPLHEL